MEYEESINCWKCQDDKKIGQKQRIYYYIGQQEDGRAIVKTKMKEEQERK